jgi:hypothetical protein
MLFVQLVNANGPTNIDDPFGDDELRPRLDR